MILDREVTLEVLTMKQRFEGGEYGPPLPAMVAHLPHPKEQYEALNLDTKANTFSRAALREWFLVEKDLNLDI